MLDEYLKVVLVVITEYAETGDRRISGISAAVVRWREAVQMDTMFKSCVLNRFNLVLIL